jgi:hypothetical protein
MLIGISPPSIEIPTKLLESDSGEGSIKDRRYSKQIQM